MPLVHAMAKTTIVSMTTKTSLCHFIVHYRYRTYSGKNNIVAHCLIPSRRTNVVSLGIDYTEMARAQAASVDIQSYKTDFTCLEITNARLNEQEPELVCLVSTGRPRPIVPPDFRRSVFDVVHTLSHPGVKALSNWSQTNLFGRECGSRSADG